MVKRVAFLQTHHTASTLFYVNKGNSFRVSEVCITEGNYIEVMQLPASRV